MESGNTPTAPGGQTGSTPQLQRLNIMTPGHRALSAEAPPSRRSIRTPGSQGRNRATPQHRQATAGGLSASGRKVNAATTPHGRAAIRAIDSRRAAIFTPHRDRRRSLRTQRETPRNDLRGLSRLLARDTKPIPSSSSPRTTVKSESGGPRVSFRDDDFDDDDDLPRAPRLSIPIDVDDDDSPLQPHRSAGLEDENFTMQSIEMPRRALSEQTGSRFSFGSAGMSDVFAANALRSDDVGIDSAFFPPRHAIDEDGLLLAQEDVTYERIDEEEEDARRDTGRESDFGIAIPADGNESTFMIAAQAEEAGSPTGQPLEFDDFAPAHSDSGGEGDMADTQDDPEQTVNEHLETDAATAEDTVRRPRKKKHGVKTSKYGHAYPSLPAGVVKRLAQTFAQTSGARGKISPDALAAVMQASDWFFEQLGDDLKAYAEHAGRKTIDESDVLMLMRRQRQIGSSTTPFSLAQRYLPRELLQQLRMPPPAPLKKTRKNKQPAEDVG